MIGIFTVSFGCQTVAVFSLPICLAAVRRLTICKSDSSRVRSKSPHHQGYKQLPDTYTFGRRQDVGGSPSKKPHRPFISCLLQASPGLLRPRRRLRARTPISSVGPATAISTSMATCSAFHSMAARGRCSLTPIIVFLGRCRVSARKIRRVCMAGTAREQQGSSLANSTPMGRTSSSSRTASARRRGPH